MVMVLQSNFSGAEHCATHIQTLITAYMANLQQALYAHRYVEADEHLGPRPVPLAFQIQVQLGACYIIGRCTLHTFKVISCQCFSQYSHLHRGNHSQADRVSRQFKLGCCCLSDPNTPASRQHSRCTPHFSLHAPPFACLYWHHCIPDMAASKYAIEQCWVAARHWKPAAPAGAVYSEHMTLQRQHRKQNISESRFDVSLGSLARWPAHDVILQSSGAGKAQPILVTGCTPPLPPPRRVSGRTTWPPPLRPGHTSPGQPPCPQSGPQPARASPAGRCRCHSRRHHHGDCPAAC